MKPSRTSAVRSGQRTFSIHCDVNVDELIAGLQGDIQAAARPAAQAAAEVLYQAVIRNVESIGQKTGNLRGSIYQKYSEENSGPGKAEYHISWRTVKGSLPRAPHGHLLEFGHIQRYQAKMDKSGKWWTLKRPESYGKPKPKSGASQAEKDAYWLPRKGGPQQIAAQPFIRPASLLYPQAIKAAEAKLLEVLNA